MRKLFWIAALVFVGWCVATPEGKKFAVQLTSAVGITPPVIELDFEQLDGGMKKEAVKALHPKLDYYCYEDTKSFGDNTCNDNIALFNGMLSYNIAVFFEGDELVAVRVALQPESYAEAVKWLDAHYKRTDIKSEGSFNGGKKYPITLWKTPSGNYVLASQAETEVGETIVLWTDSFHGVKP
ncbi:MAG TPA: hypothetical protein PK031_01675 [Pseudomonadales bacterium]|nr:hypothetical protein [Pseudomonadales bacterium]